MERDYPHECIYIQRSYATDWKQQGHLAVRKEEAVPVLLFFQQKIPF